MKNKMGKSVKGRKKKYIWNMYSIKSEINLNLNGILQDRFGSRFGVFFINMYIYITEIQINAKYQ